MLYTKEEVEKFLKDNADEKYRDFHSRLTRSNYPINGVRVPILRAYGKSLATRDNVTEFLQSESKYYEEIMLKGIVLSSMLKKSDDFELLERFLLEIDDWAVCDVACGGLKRKDSLYLDKCVAYAKSKHIWTARWGIVSFMTNFCDKSDELRELAYNIVAEDYYIDMALAWLIQVLCVKNRQVAEELLASPKISDTVKKMAVRKIKDSFRISQEDKACFAALAFA
ncbi:MAG: DNA alkylation repair protein [Clostridia bacterium]|nr:DNA alkylation repair protein [Clostridia bacterium]MDE6758996.1 DNA alkylation repair protein [Clostridia bacterium]